MALKYVFTSACMLSYVWLFVTPWTVAHQAPLSMRFARQDYWSWLPIPFSGDLPHLGTEPTSPVFPAVQMDSLLLEPSRSPCIYWAGHRSSFGVFIRSNGKPERIFLANPIDLSRSSQTCSIIAPVPANSWLPPADQGCRFPPSCHLYHVVTAA